MFFIAQFLTDEYQKTQFYYSFMDFVQYIKKNYHDGFISIGCFFNRKTVGATFPLHLFDIDCLGNSGDDQTTKVRPLQNSSIRSVPSLSYSLLGHQGGSLEVT